MMDVPVPYWPRWKPQIDKRPRGLTLAFALPMLRTDWCERYCLEFLSTWRGPAQRRLLVVITLGGRKFFRIEWQTKFKPIYDGGYWSDDRPGESEPIHRLFKKWAA